jgi:hypothetical protein
VNHARRGLRATPASAAPAAINVVGRQEDRMLRTRRVTAAVLACVALTIIGTGTAMGHETREVAGYTIVIGLLDEPVYAGQKSGLDLRVSKGDAPVEGLQDTLKAEVIYQDQKRDIPISAAFGTPGSYRSVFFPTAAGPYTFHIFGTIEQAQIDESFTSKTEGGFNLVQDAQTGQFPVVFPPTAEVVSEAQSGQDASGLIPFAMILGGLGLLVGLVALGLTLAGRRKAAVEG